MKVVYKGDQMTDGYTLDAADLAKAGVEGFRKTRFPNGEPVEVEDKVGEVLIDDKGVFASHPFEKVEEEEVEAKSADGSGDEGSGDEGSVDSSSIQQTDESSAGTADTDTGNGSSTDGAGAAKKTTAKRTSSSSGTTT